MNAARPLSLARFLVPALLILTLPVITSAQYRRGAHLLVTGQDGQRIEGELIAIKPDTMVLLAEDLKVESVLIAEIRNIKILRKSKAWQGLLGGFVAGAVGGAIWGGIGGEDGDFGVVGGAVFGALVLGVPASLVGLAAGMGAGLDDEIDLAGLPEPEVKRILAKLSRQAREPGAGGFEPRITTAGEPGMRPAPSGYARRRFRLTWMPGGRVGGHGFSFEPQAVSFRFLGELPPEEAGPFSVLGHSWRDRPTFSLGRLTLAYAWTSLVASEVELHVSGRHTEDRFVELYFTSTLDGLTYNEYLASREIVSSTSLLIGLSVRPLQPSFLQPHAVELGAAVGPAWISWEGTDAYAYDPSNFFWTDSRRTSTLTARGRASYDYHFNPAFSMGAFAEYRWIRAEIPSYARTEILVFNEASYPGGTLTRTTEVTFPGWTFPLGGMSCGLRFSLGF